MGHHVTNRPTPRADVVLLNGFTLGVGKALRPSTVAAIRRTGRLARIWAVLPAWVDSLLRRSGPPVVHRVDGVPRLVRGVRSDADETLFEVNRLADFTIFQSSYCRASFEESAGQPSSACRTISNAVDPRIFYPTASEQKLSRRIRLVSVSWSSNRRKGFETLAQLSHLDHVEVTFAGNWCPDVDSASVRMAGALDREQLADLLRCSDAMVHAAWNEPCSNAIVEAMACGLPVIYRNSGGSAELAGNYGVALDQDLAGSIEELRDHYAIIRARLAEDRWKFLIPRAAREYVEVFEHLKWERASSSG